jgi:hypothetical protein
MVALSLRVGSNTEVATTKGFANAKTEAVAGGSRVGLGVVATGLAFGAASFFYLAVDTLSAGVFGGQQGIPFASMYRQDARSLWAGPQEHLPLASFAWERKPRGCGDVFQVSKIPRGTAG